MSIMEPLTIFIGYDEREHDVYKYCEHSIRRFASVPVNIIPLNHRELRKKGFFNRQWLTQSGGQYVDMREERPFSVQFSFTRFLVPAICRSMGIDEGLAMFVDCDFIFRDDVKKLFDHCNQDPKKAVWVVKHDYKSNNQLKMDDCSQKNYNMKLWSSLMLFNIAHYANGDLTPDVVNRELGLWLHNFKWLPDESYIGGIPERWNFIPDHSEPRVDAANDLGAIHYTEGGPWFQGKENCDYSDVYYEEEKLYHLSKCLDLWGIDQLYSALTEEKDYAIG